MNAEILAAMKQARNTLDMVRRCERCPECAALAHPVIEELDAAIAQAEGGEGRNENETV